MRLIVVLLCVGSALALPSFADAQGAPKKKDEPTNTQSFLEEYGLAIQVTSAAILVIGIGAVIMIKMRKKQDAQPPGPRKGMTLIELLVVLVILVILTTVAIQATSGLVDQGRYDATQRTLGNLQDAIMGPANLRAPDGSQLISGFVADMGRLPTPNAAGGDPLRELWDGSVIATTSVYGIQVVNVPNGTGSTTVPNLLYPPASTYNPGTTAITVTGTMPCGWRGPYLQLSSGSNGFLLDGWGNAFDALNQTTTPSLSLVPATPGVVINIVRSRGADNQVDPNPLPASFSPYNLDQYAPSQISSPPPSQLASFTDRASGSVPFVVKTFNTATSPPSLSDPLPVGAKDGVQIVLFFPNGGVLTTQLAVNTSVTPNKNYWTLPAAPSTTPTPVAASFTGVPIGPRAVQAFQFDTTTGNVSKRTAMTYLMVPNGGVPTQTLILQ